MVVALGLDLSTQQLKGILIEYCDHSFKVLKEEYICFDDIVEYRTIGGVLIYDLKSVKAPVLMWVKALELLLSKFTAQELEKVDVISGCGQQHGSVYWANGALNILKILDSKLSLKDQLQNSFSILESPIWMDSSTTEQTRVLEDVVGGSDKMAQITGSAGIERFTGSQILKIRLDSPHIYENTERISLVSSFIASILIQKYAPIDVSDGSGMNLLDIQSKTWVDVLLKATGNDLIGKLGSKVAKGSDIVGNIGHFFVDKYKFSSRCVVSAFTGDNPASLSSMVWEGGDLMISLGTSDTLFLSVEDPITNTFSHVLCHPNLNDSYMAMIVYKNGSLTREAVRDEFCQSSWDLFNQQILNTEPGCNGYMGFYYKVPEISPRIRAGFFFYNGLQRVQKVGNNLHPRLIIESQFMAMKRHATKIGFSPQRIIATGGASQNQTILQICSDIFGIPVFQADGNPNSAALGSAFRGIAALKDIPVNEVIPKKNFQLITKPRSEFKNLYQNLMIRQEEIEAIFLSH